MHEIWIDIADKIAQVRGNPVIVCGNADYTVHFTFDAEWDAYDAKTARFVRLENGIPVNTDVLFTGNTVKVPALYDTNETAIGVYAGDIRTSTPAYVPCSPCILKSPDHGEPDPDLYTQILQYLVWLAGGSGCVSSAALSADAVTEYTVFHTAEWEAL